MRRLALAGIAVALLVVASSSALADKPPVGVRYDWSNYSGVLFVRNATDLPVRAIASNGDTVLRTIAVEQFVAIPCPNTGASEDGVLLTVVVGSATFSVKDKEWQWD